MFSGKGRRWRSLPKRPVGQGRSAWPVSVLLQPKGRNATCTARSPNVTPVDKMAGRAEAIWAARKEKLATASARRRAKAEEKEIARPQSSEVH